MDIAGHPGRAFYIEEEGVPAYDELIVVANNTRLNDKRLKAFIDGLEAGVEYLINHPDESWSLFIKRYPELNDELNKRAWKDTLSRFALRPGALDTRRYRRFEKFLIDSGILKKSRPVGTYAIEMQ
jgi:putative hydroxymethylpyrimidine transport system substrate-binding protein